MNIIKHIKKVQYTWFLTVSLCFTFLVLVISFPVYASPVTGFNAGDIIDDGVFTNVDSMGTSQTLAIQNIQTFLNSKVTSCDTNGTQPASDFGRPDITHAQYAASVGWPSPPYVCLKNYTENGLTASQIIYNVAKQYQINPQVLIVLLQKEQGLVADSWPLPSEYRTATGYGCPDSTPGVCDSTYYGFTNQLTWSGKMFRAILNNNPNWYTPYVLGNNFIQWSPDSSCGGSTVNIQNRATQALYNYTPYQPNQASLNAGYGGPVTCGSYGNRNFYLYFTDWFGSVRYTFGIIPSYMSVYARSTDTAPSFDTSSVGRLYNPDTKDFLYTTSQVEARLAITYGYIWDGVVFKSDSSDPNSVPIYRISNSEGHMYTSSASTRDAYINSYGYKDEGIGFYAYATSVAGSVPVYSVQQAQRYLLTSAAKEAEYYQSNYGYNPVGIAFYTKALNTSQTPVYRLSKVNTRFYTINADEKNYAIAAGYSDEGVTASADSYPDASNIPIYRLRSPQGIHFYTQDRAERDSAVINYGYESEGIGFYTLLYSNNPIYRSTNYHNGLRIFTDSYTENQTASAIYGFNNEGIGWYSY